MFALAKFSLLLLTPSTAPIRYRFPPRYLRLLVLQRETYETLLLLFPLPTNGFPVKHTFLTPLRSQAFQFYSLTTSTSIGDRHAREQMSW
jgi:hypothetical protein